MNAILAYLLWLSRRPKGAAASQEMKLLKPITPATIRLNPENAVAYYNRGNSYYRQGDYERAVADFDAALRLNPEYAAAYNNRGNAYSQRGDYERAITDYDAALRLSPEYAAAYSNRGNAYSQQGDYERAIADYDAALRLNPEDAIAYNSRGSTYTTHGVRIELCYTQRVATRPASEPFWPLFAIIKSATEKEYLNVSSSSTRRSSSPLDRSAL